MYIYMYIQRDVHVCVCVYLTYIYVCIYRKYKWCTHANVKAGSLVLVKAYQAMLLRSCEHGSYRLYRLRASDLVADVMYCIVECMVSDKMLSCIILRVFLLWRRTLDQGSISLLTRFIVYILWRRFKPGSCQDVDVVS